MCLKAQKPELAKLNSGKCADLLKLRRIELGMTQAQVAEMLGVSKWTYRTWELGRRPSARCYPAIIRYVGREPWPLAATFGDEIRAERLGRAPTAKWTGWFLRERLKIATVKSHGVFVVPASELPKLNALAHRYGMTNRSAA